MSVPQSHSSQGPSSEQANLWNTVDPEVTWADLDAAAKHERLLHAAARLFATEGMDAPMPAVAALAGAGVGSLYRQFPSKRELLAALVVRRLDQIGEAAAVASSRRDDHWLGLNSMLWTFAERQADADFLGDAWTQVQTHERVQAAAARAYAAIDGLLDLARAEGTLRQDATGLDIRLIFVAVRVSREVHIDAWKRVVTVMIDGLAAKPQR
jgi:AcrR family transcriptional regulator